MLVVPSWLVSSLPVVIFWQAVPSFSSHFDCVSAKPARLFFIVQEKDGLNCPDSFGEIKIKTFSLVSIQSTAVTDTIGHIIMSKTYIYIYLFVLYIRDAYKLATATDFLSFPLSSCVLYVIAWYVVSRVFVWWCVVKKWVTCSHRVCIICQKDLLECYLLSKNRSRNFTSRNENSHFAGRKVAVETLLVDIY